MYGRSTTPRWSRETSSPSSALCTVVRGGAAPDHVVVHDGRFLGQARALVVVLQGHDQHGVRIVAERHEVRHAPDGGAVRGGGEGRLVDRAVRRDEAVIDAIERPAGLLPLRLGPALVLGLQDTAGVVAQGDEGGQAAAQQGAIGLQGGGAVGDRHGLPLLDLHEGLRRCDKETAFRQVGLQRWQRGRGRAGCAGAVGWAVYTPWGRCWMAAASWAARSPVAVRVYPSLP